MGIDGINPGQIGLPPPNPDDTSKVSVSFGKGVNKSGDKREVPQDLSLDSVHSLDGELAFNFSASSDLTLANLDKLTQGLVDNLDPANPAVPLVICCCDDGVSDAAAAKGAAKASAAGVKKSGGNPWLAGNAYVAFVVNFMELGKLLQENVRIEAEVEVTAMDMMYEIGKAMSDKMRAAGKEARKMHLMAGSMAIVSAVTAAATTTLSVRSMSKGMKLNGQVLDPMTISQIFSGVKETISGGTRATEEFYKAKHEMRKTNLEADKELLSTVSRLISHGMDQASAAIRANQELFSQLIQQLDQIRGKLHDAISASLRKG